MGSVILDRSEKNSPHAPFTGYFEPAAPLPTPPKSPETATFSQKFRHTWRQHQLIKPLATASTPASAPSVNGA
jgi:hypothetical protein